jgi:hypothetical protein
MYSPLGRGAPQQGRLHVFSPGQRRTAMGRGFWWGGEMSARPPSFPLDHFVARTRVYTYAVTVWDLSIVQGPFSVALCRFALLHRCTRGRTCMAPLRRARCSIRSAVVTSRHCCTKGRTCMAPLRRARCSIRSAVVTSRHCFSKRSAPCVAAGAPASRAWPRLSVTQRCISVTQRCISVIQRCISVTQRAMSVTQRDLSVTQRALSATQKTHQRAPETRAWPPPPLWTCSPPSTR